MASYLIIHVEQSNNEEELRERPGAENGGGQAGP